MTTHATPIATMPGREEPGGTAARPRPRRRAARCRSTGRPARRPTRWVVRVPCPTSSRPTLVHVSPSAPRRPAPTDSACELGFRCEDAARRASRRVSAQGGEHLRRGPPARGHRPVHVARPHAGGLGAGPVDGPDRLAQAPAVPGPHVGPEQRAVAPPAPRLGLPVELHEIDRVSRLGPEVAHEGVEHGLAPHAGVDPSQTPGLVAFEEPEQDARRWRRAASCRTRRGPPRRRRWPGRSSPRRARTVRRRWRCT